MNLKIIKILTPPPLAFDYSKEKIFLNDQERVNETHRFMREISEETMNKTLKELNYQYDPIQSK